jgi:hypothetical protein
MSPKNSHHNQTQPFANHKNAINHQNNNQMQNSHQPQSNNAVHPIVVENEQIFDEQSSSEIHIQEQTNGPGSIYQNENIHEIMDTGESRGIRVYFFNNNLKYLQN